MPKEVLKICHNKSFQITQTHVGIIKFLRSGGVHLGLLKIPIFQFVQTLFKLSCEAIIWQNQLTKVFVTFPPSMEIYHDDNKSNSDEKKPHLMAKKVSLRFCLGNSFPMHGFLRILSMLYRTKFHIQ